MRKVLVLDEEPRTCYDCQLEQELVMPDRVLMICAGTKGQKIICNGLDSGNIDKRGRLAWCPLRELPDKVETNEFLGDFAFGAGWNTVLDIIEKGEG